MIAKLKRSDVFAAFADSLTKRDESGRTVIESDLADALQIIMNEYGQGMHASLDAAFGKTQMKPSNAELKNNRIRPRVLALMIKERDQGTPFKSFSNKDGIQAGAFERVAAKLKRDGISAARVERIWSDAINNEWLGTPEDIDIHIKGFSKIGR